MNMVRSARRQLDKIFGIFYMITDARRWLCAHSQIGNLIFTHT